MHSTAQRKEHSKTEFEKREFLEKFEKSETFSGGKFSPATGVTKRTGEKEYKIKKTKKIHQIYFLILRKKLRSPPTTTSYYR